MADRAEIRIVLPIDLHKRIVKESRGRGASVGNFARQLMVEAFIQFEREEERQKAILAGAVFPDSVDGKKD